MGYGIWDRGDGRWEMGYRRWEIGGRPLTPEMALFVSICFHLWSPAQTPRRSFRVSVVRICSQEPGIRNRNSIPNPVHHEANPNSRPFVSIRGSE